MRCRNCVFFKPMPVSEQEMQTFKYRCAEIAEANQRAKDRAVEAGNDVPVDRPFPNPPQFTQGWCHYNAPTHEGFVGISAENGCGQFNPVRAS